MIRLDIGPEPNLPRPSAKKSKHVVDLKTLDGAKKIEAHSKVTLNMKEEIRMRTLTPDKIQIVGKNYGRRRGLGRIPMLIAALAMILLLNVGQLLFLGKRQGEEALALASQGFMTLQGAGQSFTTGESGGDILLFNQAEQLFEEAKQEGAFLLNTPTPWLDEPAQVKSLRNILDAGSLMASIGVHLSEAKVALELLPKEGSLTEHLRQVSTSHLEPAADEITKINRLLNEVDLTGTGYESQFAEYQSKLLALENMLTLWVAIKEPLLTALGDTHPQTYLVLLQNNDEMRLGGGFIGSFVLVTLNDGRLTQMDFHDVYEYDGQYHGNLEVPLHELRELTPIWRLRDSNISPDFSVSAQKAAWFLEEEGGPGVDGVIAVNLSSAQAFLEVTGPLTLASLPRSLNAEDLPSVLATLVESKTYGATTPKAILNELLTAFSEKAKDPALAAQLFFAAWQETQNKSLSFYHKDPAIQTLFESMDMAGALPNLNELSAETEMPSDYFMPLFTNIGGNKTDRYVESAVSHNTQILEDGSMVVTVEMTRIHSFTETTENALKDTLRNYGFAAWNDALLYTLGKANNQTGIRLYVPEGAQLLETQGLYKDEVQFFYDPSEDHSYFYFDQNLEPGEAQTVTLQWALPWKFQGEFQEYHFNWFKQPGLKNTTFTKTVSAPNDILLSSIPAATQTEKGYDYTYETSTSGDLDFTLLYR
ncbi:DUF4012 domain-containing protein [Candidatus Peregrinibacteria bacterium]|nr:MAG: DUF4012 domain-containing protein [Candidatus Peregrinibacteria bacterium]